MISIIISKIPLHVYLLIRLGRDVNSEMHLFYKLLCTLQYGRPQQPLHTINPHPIRTPWNICPMVNVIPHVVGQTVPVSFYSIYPMPKKPPGECDRGTRLVHQLDAKGRDGHDTVSVFTHIYYNIIPTGMGLGITVEGGAPVRNNWNIGKRGGPEG